MAPNHQHFFNARLDLDIDGEQNTAQEVNTLSVPPGPENPHSNAFFAEVNADAHGSRRSAKHQSTFRPFLACRE